MPYDSITNRTDSAALVPEEVSDVLLKELSTESAAMSMFAQVPMATSQTRMPALSALPTAYFVNGDTGLKQTTELAWTNKYLNVEEIAAIVPIPEAVVDDMSFDVWGAIRPKLVTAISRTLDAAIFFGTNKPASWPDSIKTDCVDASNTVNRGTNNAAAGGIYGDFSDAYGKVEADGYDVNGIVATTTYKGRMRQARATTGEHLDEEFSQEIRTLIRYPMRGLWGATTGDAEVILGDFTQALLGVRQDVTYKILDQAVIQDGSGNIVFNLAQQDMVALRVVARFAFQIANTVNYDNSNDATRYPFAALLVP